MILHNTPKIKDSIRNQQFGTIMQGRAQVGKRRCVCGSGGQERREDLDTACGGLSYAWKGMARTFRYASLHAWTLPTLRWNVGAQRVCLEVHVVCCWIHTSLTAEYALRRAAGVGCAGVVVECGYHHASVNFRSTRSVVIVGS